MWFWWGSPFGEEQVQGNENIFDICCSWSIVTSHIYVITSVCLFVVKTETQVFEQYNFSLK